MGALGTPYPLFQQAWLVNDLDASMKYWHDTFGAGPFSVTDVKVGLVDCSGAAPERAPGMSTTCTADYVVTQADIDRAFEPLLATIQIIWEHMPHLSQALTMLRDAATAALPSNVEDDSSLAELLGDVDYAAEELALATEDMTAVREILSRYRLR